jgi:hypothetical protein
MPLATAMHNTAASTVLAKYQAFLGGSGSGFCCFLPRGAGAAGCGSSGKTDAAPKDYTQILHDARPDEDNEYYMIFSPGKEGKFTAQYGYSESYEDADQLDEEIRNMLLPLLNLEEGDYTDFSASVSGMMVQSYALAIVKPAEGKQQAVSEALDAYVQSQMQSMEHYLEDQYQIAASSHISTAPTGEVILVCCENPEAVMNAIKTALAA